MADRAPGTPARRTALVTDRGRAHRPAPSTGGAPNPTPPSGALLAAVPDPVLDVGCGPGRIVAALAAAGRPRARRRPQPGGGRERRPPPGPGPAPLGLRPAAGRGSMGHGAAARRQRRHRRRPRRAAARGRRAAAPGRRRSWPRSSRRAPPTGAGDGAGGVGRRRRPVVPVGAGRRRPVRGPGRPTPACGRRVAAASGRRLAGRTRVRDGDPRRAAVVRPGGPAVTRDAHDRREPAPRRGWAWPSGSRSSVCFATGVWSHLAQDPPALVHLAGPPGRAVPDHPGRARRSRGRLRSRCCWPSCGWSPPGWSRGRRCASALHARRAAGAAAAGRRRRCSCCCRGRPTWPAGTRGGSSSPGPTSGRRGSRSARWSSTSAPRRPRPGTRSAVAGRPLAGAPTRAAADGRRGAAFLGAASPRLAGPRRRHRGGTVAPLPGLSVLAQRRPATGPRACRSTRRRRRAGWSRPRPDPGYRLVVDGAVRRPLSLSLRRPAGPAAAPRRPCPSPASRAGARPPGGAACRCATCWRWRARRRGARGDGRVAAAAAAATAATS